MGPQEHLQVIYNSKRSLLFQNYEPADLSGNNRVNPLVPLRTPWPWWSSGRICTHHHLSSPLKAGWAFLSLYLHHTTPMSQGPARKHSIVHNNYQMIIIRTTQSLLLLKRWVNITWGSSKPYWVTDNQVTRRPVPISYNGSTWLALG